jgi:hypothetical protein
MWGGLNDSHPVSSFLSERGNVSTRAFALDYMAKLPSLRIWDIRHGPDSTE